MRLLTKIQRMYVNGVTPLLMAAKYDRSSFVQKVFKNNEETNPADKLNYTTRRFY